MQQQAQQQRIERLKNALEKARTTELAREHWLTFSTFFPDTAEVVRAVEEVVDNSVVYDIPPSGDCAAPQLPTAPPPPAPPAFKLVGDCSVHHFAHSSMQESTAYATIESVVYDMPLSGECAAPELPSASPLPPPVQALMPKNSSGPSSSGMSTGTMNAPPPPVQALMPKNSACPSSRMSKIPLPRTKPSPRKPRKPK